MATERDRETARYLLADGGAQPEYLPTFVASIAEALAAERERARAPFARVTEDLDLLAARYTRAATGSYDDGIRCASANSANMLRAAALDAEL